MKKSKIVAHKNSLVSDFISLGLQEKRFLAYCIAQLDPKREKEFNVLTVKVADIAEVFSIGSSWVYPRLKEAAKTINGTPVEQITDTSYRIDFFFKSLEFFPDSGKIDVHFNEHLAPLLLDLQTEYLQYPLEMTAGFNNSSWSLYEALKQWLPAKRHSFTLDELKEIFSAVGKYPRWNNFKTRLLDPSVSTINETSDLQINYELVKSGRSVSGVVFFIDTKQPDDVITLEPEKDTLYKALLDYGINSKVALQYSREAEEADKTVYIIERLPKIKARWDKKKEGNLQAYVTTAVQQEIRQGSLLNYTPEQPKKLEHTEAWECLQEKKRLGEQCAVRERGIPGQRKRCKICLEKLPVAEYGI